MTIPSSGGNNPPISMYDVNSDPQDGFGLGWSMSAYRGQIYDNKSGGVGLLPAGPSISLSDFYGKRRVDAGSRSGFGSGSQTVPPYRTITIYVYGGSGGGGGGQGYLGYAGCSLDSAGSGTAGSGSTVGASGDAWYRSASGGSGGPGGGAGGPTPGANGAGADGSSPAGGGGGANQGSGSAGGAGGRGGKSTITLTNPILGGTGPVSGSAISYSIGGGGGRGGGGAGKGKFVYPSYWDCNLNGQNGDPGVNGNSGYGGMSWT